MAIPRATSWATPLGYLQVYNPGYPQGYPKGYPLCYPLGYPLAIPYYQATPLATPLGYPKGNPTGYPLGRPWGYPLGYPPDNPPCCPPCYLLGHFQAIPWLPFWNSLGLPHWLPNVLSYGLTPLVTPQATPWLLLKTKMNI